MDLLRFDLAVADEGQLVRREGLDYFFFLAVDLEQVVRGAALVVVLVHDQVAIGKSEYCIAD